MPIKDGKIEIKMDLKKETKGTVVYEAEAEYVTSLYISKFGLDKPYPNSIVITIKEA